MKFLQALLFLLCLSTQIYGQSEGKYVTITTNEGDKISGELIREDSESITVATKIGETKITRTNIAYISYIKEDGEEGKYEELPVDGKDNSYSSSHYLFTQSGYGLRKGQSYYENIYVFFNSYTVGVTDNIQVSFGGEIASILFFGRFPTLFISPKFSIPFEFGAVSVGTTLFRIPIDNFNGNNGIYAGALQGALTLGSRENNVTFGTGFGYGSGGTGIIFEDSFVPITISGMTQLSEKISLVSENWFFPGANAGGILTLGLRFHTRNNNNYFTAALIRPTGDTGGLVAIPFISGTIPLR